MGVRDLLLEAGIAPRRSPALPAPGGSVGGGAGRTNLPSSFRRDRITLDSTPSSLASSWTRIFATLGHPSFGAGSLLCGCPRRHELRRLDAVECRSGHQQGGLSVASDSALAVDATR